MSLSKLMKEKFPYTFFTSDNGMVKALRQG